MHGSGGSGGSEDEDDRAGPSDAHRRDERCRRPCEQGDHHDLGDQRSARDPDHGAHQRREDHADAERGETAGAHPVGIGAAERRDQCAESGESGDVGEPEQPADDEHTAHCDADANGYRERRLAQIESQCAAPDMRANGVREGGEASTNRLLGVRGQGSRHQHGDSLSLFY